ncbi:MAG: hypothetical protein J7J38_00290 [Candidatus Aenigmarchaeota archaeon]|nr:hypothetical protein [Candidatus Aenigmarchaeota archaeon]
MIESKRLELILQELIRRANRSDRRLRIIEQRTQALESRTGSIEDINFKQSKDIKKRIIDMEFTIKSFSDRIIKIENDINRISEQLKGFAKKNEVKEIESMFDLLNPIKQDFVTKKELEEILKRR